MVKTVTSLPGAAAHSTQPEPALTPTRRCLLLGLAAGAGLAADARSCSAQTSTVAGWSEEVVISADAGRTAFVLSAKLDTGAETSSLAASGIEINEREGATWVRFRPGFPRDGLPEVEARLVRWAYVRRASTEPQRRPVVRLELCLAGLSADADFTLVDRSGMRFAVLIGRAFLSGRVMIDPSRRNVGQGTCRLLAPDARTGVPATDNGTGSMRGLATREEAAAPAAPVSGR